LALAAAAASSKGAVGSLAATNEFDTVFRNMLMEPAAAALALLCFVTFGLDLVAGMLMLETVSDLDPRGVAAAPLTLAAVPLTLAFAAMGSSSASDEDASERDDCPAWDAGDAGEREVDAATGGSTINFPWPPTISSSDVALLDVGWGLADVAPSMAVGVWPVVCWP
jgi:hypothetical protein